MATILAVLLMLLTWPQTGEFLWQADVLRIDGELRLRLGASTDQAGEISLFQALKVARKQRAKSFELRATSMARPWRDQGRRDQARELLASVYG